MSDRWRLVAFAVASAAVATVLLGAVFFPATAYAGIVRFFPSPVMELPVPDTRGGMVMDDKYVWIAHHARGLWRVDRCTGANPGETSAQDGKSWDLWYHDPYGNYPKYPDAGSPNPKDGYFIYMAGAFGNVFIFNSANPSILAGNLATNGGVAYGVYATEPTATVAGGVPKLYVATTSGLKVYDIGDPALPVESAPTILPSLDFISVRGSPGHGYVYANSFTDNKTYIIDIATNSVVGSIAYGGANSVRRMWVHTDESGKVYVYSVNHSGDLWITDVTNPLSPNLATFWDSPAGGIANMPGGSVYVQKEYAFVLTSNGNDQGYVYMLDIRNPYNPVLVNTLYDAAFGFNDIRLDGREIHVAAHDGWKMYIMEGWDVDACISNRDTSNFVGRGVLEMPASTQIKSQVVNPGETAVYQIRVENRADRRDRVQLSGIGLDQWTSKYYIEGSDVTTAVLDGSYVTRYLEPGEYLYVTLKMTPSTAIPGVVYQAPLTTNSWMAYGSEGA